MKNTLLVTAMALAPAVVLAQGTALSRPPIPLMPSEAAGYVPQAKASPPEPVRIIVATPPPSTSLAGIPAGPAPRAAVMQPPRDLAMDQYFTGSDPVLNAREKRALAIAKQWQDGGSTGMLPTPGADGAIRYVFGSAQPSIVCAVLQVCDVELEPGEQVNSINLGDSARWLVDPAITGSGPSEIQHLIIKPQDVGLETSLVVTTNRRSYHFLLRSHRTEFMPRVSFTYPEDAAAKWEALRAREIAERKQNTIPQTGEYLGDLSFDYAVIGEARWKPVRVYNDGRKTIIQMAAAMSQTEAPSLLVVRRKGGVFSDEETTLVNYRVQGDRYIVDAVFDQAILVAGVGSSQDRITIKRGK